MFIFSVALYANDVYVFTVTTLVLVNLIGISKLKKNKHTNIEAYKFFETPL